MERKLILFSKCLILCGISLILSQDRGDFIRINPKDSFQLSETKEYRTTVPMSSKLWEYLRSGLSYLESSGKNYPPNFIHPGGKAYGTLGLSRIAARDVINNCPALSRVSLDEVFSQQAIYEEFARNYADLLLRHYLGINYDNMSPAEVFDILQRAWFLGPTLYKKGTPVILSREVRAREYILEIAATFSPSPVFKMP